MVAVEALVVLVQGYQTNPVMILVNLLPGGDSEILVPSVNGRASGGWLVPGAAADFASSENWYNHVGNKGLC